MSAIGRIGKGAVLGTLAVAFGAGAIAGVVAERALIGRNLRRSENGEPFGSLHSEPIEIIASDGVKLHAEVEEAIDQHDDVTVVFAHGYALRLDEFHYQRRDLRGIARLVFYDQRGHGRSERGTRESHTVAQLAADLELVIDQLAPNGKVILVGHSMGGMTIQALAGLRPDLFGQRVQSVILICTSSGGVSEIPLGLPGNLGKLVQNIAPVVTGALKGQQEIVDKSREAASDLMKLLTRRYSFGSGATADLTDFVAFMHGNTAIDVIADFLHALGEYDSTTDLAVLGRINTTVVAAANDLMTPPSHSQKIADAVPTAVLITMDDTGHMLPLERYVELNDLIAQEIRRVRSQ